MMPLLYATTNPGKVMEVNKHLAPHGIVLVSPAQIGLDLEVDETGSTLEENATLKAQAYLQHAPGRVVMADDTGIEIDALGGEPGIHVRRWKDRQTPMSDAAIIDYCLQRMHGIPPGQRQAQFRTVIALGIPGGAIECFDGILRGDIRPSAAPLKYAGMPFETLFYISEWGKLLGDIHDLSPEAKSQHGYFSHRERAIQNALPRLRELLVRGI
jgi:XTP/dITP diphosphohydrolase